jgi:hypothetical protein
MDPSTYQNLLTQQGEALQGASMVPFLGSSHCRCSPGSCKCGLGAANSPPKPNPIPYTQRGGSILAVAGLFLLGGFLARNRDMTLPSQMMYGTGAMAAGYGIARLT